MYPLRQPELEIGQVFAQRLRAKCQALLHRLVDAARMRFVVAERQEQCIGMLQNGTRAAHHVLLSAGR